MKGTFTLGAMVVILTLAVSLWTGTARADEQFQTLTGIQAEALPYSELATVEGKLLGGINLLGLLGSGNRGLLGGNNRGLLGLGLLGGSNTGLLGLGGRGSRSLLNP